LELWQHEPQTGAGQGVVVGEQNRGECLGAGERVRAAGLGATAGDELLAEREVVRAGGLGLLSGLGELLAARCALVVGAGGLGRLAPEAMCAWTPCGSLSSRSRSLTQPGDLPTLAASVQVTPVVVGMGSEAARSRCGWPRRRDVRTRVRSAGSLALLGQRRSGS
jgi:hypothetical protein